MVEPQRFRHDTLPLLVVPRIVQSVDSLVALVVLYPVRIRDPFCPLEHKQAFSGLILLLLVNRQFSPRVRLNGKEIAGPHGVSAAAKVGAEKHDDGFVAGLGFGEEVVERRTPETVQDPIRVEIVGHVGDEFVHIDDADPSNRAEMSAS